ncbi:hypothetical protein AWB85_18000 [Mycobacteroides immunogenum]|uniref:Cytochrome n=1 Tax=Mycobacteroides immunogenum TaxID=83262 RepID=A0A179V3W2_9MYCO|nr:cytochrome P450 [Mycobacteroides immunogenum]OAT66590.1 hypothetical protein AWB85_18000 [Mycobacteroides immunogenum]
MTTVAELPYLAVEDPGFNEDPYGVIRPIQAKSPLARNHAGIELLSYQACRELLDKQDTTLDMSYLGRPMGIHDGRAHQFLKESFTSKNGPDNLKIRKAILPYYSPNRLMQFREGVRAKVRGMIEAAREDDVVDFAPIAQQLPSRMAAAMMGAPDSDWPRVDKVSSTALKLFTMDPANREEAVAGILDSEQYARELIELNRQDPGKDNFVQALLKAKDDGRLSDDEVVFTVSTMLQGSVDTTQAQLASMVVLFAQHPDQWRHVQDDPELIKNAVVEASRYYPTIWRFARFAVAGGAEVANVKVEEESTLFLSVLAANRDPSVFGETANEFNVTVERPRPPLNWGLGVHFCPGRHLSIMEMEETLRVLIEDYESIEMVKPMITRGAPDVIVVSEALLRLNRG